MRRANHHANANVPWAPLSHFYCYRPLSSRLKGAYSLSRQSYGVVLSLFVNDKVARCKGRDQQQNTLTHTAQGYKPNWKWYLRWCALLYTEPLLGNCVVGDRWCQRRKSDLFSLCPVCRSLIASFSLFYASIDWWINQSRERIFSTGRAFTQINLYSIIIMCVVLEARAAV